MNTDKTVLVLGATGGIGGEVARQLRDAGWSVRGMKRQVEAAVEQRDGITWVPGDALVAADVLAAAEGCAVIIHAVNPPGYRNWGKLVLPMLDNTIAAARKINATVVLPGTLYNYGPSAFPVISEDSLQQPLTRKGMIRVEMEQRLQQYAQQGGRVIIVRAGDFFGPHAGNSWFAQGLIKPGKMVTSITKPGAEGVGHQWAYLPDVAHTMLLLLERRDRLEHYANFHMAGHWDADGTAMVEAISRVVTQRSGKTPGVAAFPWWLIRMLAPFQETLRELLEMRYLWRQPVRMDNGRLTALLGREPQTPLDQAIEITLQGLGCLPQTLA